MALQSGDFAGLVEIKTPRSESFWRGPAAVMPAQIGLDAGIWEVVLSAGVAAKPAYFTLVAEGDAYPFIVPGPGIVRSHFVEPEPCLLMSPDQPFTLWTDVPIGLSQMAVQSWLPADACVVCRSPEGRETTVAWRNLPDCPHRTGIVSVEGDGGWWRLSGKTSEEPCRFTIWEGLPLFFERPPMRFPYPALSCHVSDEAGSPTDARVEVLWNRRTTAVRDLVAGEHIPIAVLPGSVTVKVSRGIEYAPQAILLELQPGEQRNIAAQLQRALSRPAGWACGDLHMHTCWDSDGADSPVQTARAGRAQGLDFVFISDTPEAAESLDCEPETRAGGFLALPGEELLTAEVHANALNAPSSLVGLTQSDDARASVAAWLAAIRRLNDFGRPAAFMLNHPSHFPEVMAGHGYFRSWWLADEFEDIRISENFDFDSWFERLNRGRAITGLWDTDSHDSTLMPPGVKRNYVYVGSQMTESALMSGLLQGRCFCTRDPGAMLLLSANGAMVGQTAAPDEDGCVLVTVTCDAARPIGRVELIADGEIAHVWPGQGALQLTATVRLSAMMRWLIARAFVHEEPQIETGHNAEPLLATGCVAFTNPVWVKRRDQ